MNREEVFAYVKKKYGTEPDYPWMDQNAVLRHADNKKWYALVLSVCADKLGLKKDKTVDVINVKCDPVLIGSLRTKNGFFPAYHMNKNSWISILLDPAVSDGEVKGLIDLSYELTQSKRHKKKKQE